MQVATAKVLKVNLHRPSDDVALAELIADGVKTIELRGWPQDYRGPLLIEYRGKIIAVVRLVDCRPAVPADLAPAGAQGFGAQILKKLKIAWVLRDARRLATVINHSGPSQFYSLQINESQCPEYFEMV